MDALTRELTAVWRKLGRMLSNGVPLLRALGSITKETTDGQVTAALTDTMRTVETGHTFHAALSRHPGLFPPSVLTLVHSGEMAGTLEKSAMAIADGLTDGSIAPLSVTDAPPAGDRVAADEHEGLRQVSDLISSAIEARATDIHLGMAGDTPRLRLRVDGVLTDGKLPPISPDQYPVLVTLIKLMAGMNAGETQKMQDGRILLSLKGGKCDLRVNCMPCASGESVAMRILPGNRTIPPLAELDLPGPVLNGLRSWLGKGNGLVVVCGPTGSGKTTTLYSMLQEVNVPGAKVMSVEDPVECMVNGVDQVQVRPSRGITFASALRSVLRQDPDVILVGEIRDLETAQVCIQAALTGCLVLTSLHTEDAPSAVRRLIDVGLPPYLVSGTLIGAAAQRLVRKVCRECTEEYTPDDDMLKIARAQYPQITRFLRGKGCDACRGTGYRGRAAILELFGLNGETRAAINRGLTTDELHAHAVRGGMRTLQQDGMDKVAEGITTVEEVLRVCA